MNNHSESHNNSGWIFLAGIATGAVVGYLLNSDRGREIRHTTAEKVVDYGEQARHYAQEKASSAAAAVGSMVDKGKVYASELGNKLQGSVKAGAEKAEETIDDAENAFQRGANKAKSHLHEMSVS